MKNAARALAPCRPSPSSKFQSEEPMSEPNIQEAVKQKYGEAAKRAASEGTACCGGGASLSGCDPITKDLYSDAEKGALPEKAVAASLGCGNPTALAKLQPGEVVLDLGSGGGLDVILSAKRVGPTGKAYGLDMTDEMLALAGFESIEVEATRVYRVDEAREFLEAAGLDPETVGPQIDGKFISAFVRAVKPAAKSICCGPTCCP